MARRSPVKIGEKFGKLTVLEDLGMVKGTRKVLYRCDCGNKRKVQYTNIKYGAKSCGCLRKTKVEIGKRFGKLTIIKDLGVIKKDTMVLCKCDCGREKKRRYCDFKKGRYKTCGCREGINYTGKRYNNMTIIKELGSINGHRRIIYKCDCGTERITLLGKVIRNETKSCGCIGRRCNVIIGKKYNKLTILKDLGAKGGYTRVLCKCDCGRETSITINSLKRGSTKSCGCLIRSEVIIGKKYNKFTILKDLGSVNGSTRVLCKCDCGKERDVDFYSLKKGTSKSCGCIRLAEVAIGERFGRLKVLKNFGLINRTTKVLCKCDCGKETVVIYAKLQKKGGTRSCGCLSIERSTTHGFSKLSHKERIKVDIQYRIKINLRHRLKQALKRETKTGSAVRDLGCTIDELKVRLEKDFWVGMTWDNWGDWHIDHEMPLASFDLTDREQVKKACNYTNLQPLWAKDNFSKGDRFMNFYEFI